MAPLQVLKRAASVLAESVEQTPEIRALRSLIVETIKREDPAYYGLPLLKATA